MRLLSFLLFLSLLATTPGIAAESGSAPHKLAFVNVSRILKFSPQVKAIEAVLKADYEKREAELSQREEHLAELKKELKSQRNTQDISKRTELERDILVKARRLKTARIEMEEDIALQKNEEMNRLRLLIAEVIESIAKEQNIDMVFEAGVVYVSDRVDISDQILQRMKERHVEEESTDVGDDKK
ncbi:MAG: OmpH family outer membrane protein [Pseudomonadota bacterium]